MPIEIAFDNGVISVKSEFDKRSELLILSDDEKNSVFIISDIIRSSGLDFSRCHLERRSGDYLSIVCDTENDFCRIKIGARSKWFSLDLWLCDDKIKNDNRLLCVKSRNTRHWKIPLKSVDDLKIYSDIICASYKLALK